MAELVMGQRVSCLAKNFGIEWARSKYQSSWKTARVEGTVRESKGDGVYLILYDGDSELLESNVKTLRKIKAQTSMAASKSADAADDPLPSANTERKSCTTSPSSSTCI